MKRLIYILIGLSIITGAFASKITLQPDESNWQTISPNDTLVLSEVGKYKIKITEIGKYHFEQTTKDTIDFMLQANNLVDEKIKNVIPSNDALQLSFKNVTLGRKLNMGSPYSIITLKDDTCNMSLSFSGKCTLTEISNVGYNAPFVSITGKSPKCHIQVQDSLTCKLTMNGARISFIDTSLDKDDSLHYEIHPNATLITGTIKNLNGNVFYDNCNLKDFIIEQGEKSSMFIKNTTCEKNDYSWHNAVIYSKGKIYIENSTLQTTNDLTFIESSDTIFIDEKPGEKTYINALVGTKRNSLSETKYSRVVVNNASYIQEITAMTDLYNGHIGTLCPSPQIKDTLSGADVNIYGGTIGFLTNNMHGGNYGSFDVHYGNRIINFFNGKINATEVPIRLGHWYGGNITSIDNICYNDTLNLYSGTITAQKDQCLIRFTDNTCINIHNKENSDQITRIQYHPQGNRDDNWTTIRLDGGTINGDSLYWEIGDINNLKSITPVTGQLINKQALRIVYRNSKQPNDSLVIGVNKTDKHYFNDLLNTYNTVDIYHSFRRKITYVNTLDETWVTSDTTYNEGFGKEKLPRVIYAGKTFKGWFTQPEGGVKVDSISHLQMGDITLYTQWGPGQDIIYSDFDHNRLCNTGAVEIKYGKDLNNLIESGIKPLEGHNTKAMHCNVIQNEGYAKTLLYLRNSYLDNQDIYKNAPRVYMDLRSTTGISMKHKGMSVRVNVDNCYYVIPQHEELTLVNIPWEQFTLSGNRRDLENVSEIRFQPIAEQGEYWIDDIIFTQGDIYPLESIKLDTVPNKYLYTKNPDLLDIPLPIKADSTQLYLYPKFTPSDATYQAINWSSKDPSIATVDEYGRVNGISHGQTYIYCQSVMHPEVKDSILVGVEEGGIYYNLNGVSIDNTLPTTYDYSHPIALVDPEPIKNFYTFHGWHTDSINGAVVDSASITQFGNLKSHTLYAEFTRAIPDAAITVLQNRFIAVQNPNNFEELKDARYIWEYKSSILPSEKQFVEVDMPIPLGLYEVTIYIDDEMPVYLQRELDSSVHSEYDLDELSIFPNPIQAGGIARIVGKYDNVSLLDTKGQNLHIKISSDGYLKVPEEKGIYILKISKNQQIYSIKMIVI